MCELAGYKASSFKYFMTGLECLRVNRANRGHDIGCKGPFLGHISRSDSFGSDAGCGSSGAWCGMFVYFCLSSSFVWVSFSSHRPFGV